MFWIAIASVSAAAALIQLGALAVWVVVLKAMLLVAVVAAALFALGHVWRWHRDSQR